MERIIASMTTIPSRIDLIRPAVESVLAQTFPVDHVELNIPYWCTKTEQRYVIPAWLSDMEGVWIFRTDDYGPITKVAPTFLRYRGDKEKYVWSADDDCAYPANQLELLCQAHDRARYRILTRHGGNIRPDGSVQYLYGSMEVSLFEGFGTVLYPPNCVGDDFFHFLSVSSDNPECRKNDDVVLSAYFAHHGIPIYLHNQPSKENPWMHEGWLAHQHIDAASDAKGFVEANKHILEFVDGYFSSNAKRAGIGR